MSEIGNRIVRLDEVDSTNSLMLAEPRYLEAHGLVLLARHQTGGRGRMGRHWASLPGQQLQFSVALHPAFAAEHFPAVALLAGVAVAEGIEAVSALHPRLKWPNDVLVDGRKVCGILVEGKAGAGGQPRLVAGIGINCNGRSDTFPVALQPRLTTLAEAAGTPVDAERLLVQVLAAMERGYRALAAGGKAELIARWSGYGMLGAAHRVRVRARQAEHEGVPLALSPEGYLIVETADGQRFEQVSGELEWIG